jgi:hypothetical protein
MGFIGFCYSRTSGNGLYHKTERFSGVRVPTTVNASAELLNDAALNRKPYGEIDTITGEPHWANWVNLPVTIRSAFYTSTTDYGFSWKIGAGSWTDVSALTLSPALAPPAPKLPITPKIRQIDLSASLSEADTLYLRAWATNEEGTHYGAEFSFTAEETIYSTGANGVVSASGDITSSIYIYALSSTETALSSVSTSDTATGLFFYTSEYFITANKLATGWYIIGGQTGKAFYIQSGEVRKYETRTPATAYIRLSLINKGMEELPEYRAQALVIDDSNGFPNTLSVDVEIKYYTLSGETYTQTGNTVNKTMSFVDGELSSESSIVSLPPVDATHAQVTTSTSGIGMAVVSPYIAL